MDPTQWLQRYATGFRELPDDDRKAISDFSFLWSLFEAKVLECRASAAHIFEIASQWNDAGQLTDDPFRQELKYFRDRYVEGDRLSDHFVHLNLRHNDNPGLVEKVLFAKDLEANEIAAVVLIIVYRFRNNLFHGVKWSYDLQGQLDNFNHANSALMRAIELQAATNAR